MAKGDDDDKDGEAAGVCRGDGGGGAMMRDGPGWWGTILAGG